MPVWSRQPQEGQHLVNVDDVGEVARTGYESQLSHSFSPCAGPHKYRQPPELWSRAACIHWTPCGHKVRTHLLLPSSAPGQDADLGIRDTSAEVRLWVQLGLTISLTLGRVAADGDTKIFSGMPKGICFF